MNSLELLRAGKLKGSHRLNLACNLHEFPHEIFDLADSLEILDLSNNRLSSLPDNLAKLHRLKILFCSNNLFTHLPEVLGQCPNLTMIGFRANQISHIPSASLPKLLRWLVLTDNKIQELPDSIGECQHLEKLMLAGNQLSHLPNAMAACGKLALLRIAQNQFSTLPNWIFELPQLSWLAFAGNPFHTDDDAQAAQQIDWSKLTLENKLGEGASGVIYRAKWHQQSDTIDVAIKLFKANLTSDGLPENEIAATVRATQHPNLISVIGKISNHPDHIQGLVLPLLDQSLHNLASPPSLDSCTRDIYSATTIFTLHSALQIAHGIASAAMHLHANGLMNGDLYAHNIMCSADGLAILGDFGAASVLPPHQPNLADKFQQIEVLAFSILLEELCNRCEPHSRSLPEYAKLVELQQHCAQTTPAERPLFAEITSALTTLLLSAKR